MDRWKRKTGVGRARIIALRTEWRFGREIVSTAVEFLEVVAAVTGPA